MCLHCHNSNIIVFRTETATSEPDIRGSKRLVCMLFPCEMSYIALNLITGNITALLHLIYTYN